MFKNRPTLTNIIISAIFFLLGVVVTKLMEEKQQPVYSVINPPSLIYDKTRASSKIKLVLDDSLLISENIYVTTLAIWNKGKEPIEKQDVRKDFFVYCSDTASYILDYKILQENEPGISNFKLIPVGDSLRIEWDNFDPAYGLKLQIFYSGENSTSIVATGSVLGAKLRQVVLKQKASMIGLIVLLFAEVLLWSVIVWTIYSLFKEANIDRKNSGKSSSFLFPIISSLLLVMFGLFMTYATAGAFFGFDVPF
jgi:hypothetical protein